MKKIANIFLYTAAFAAVVALTAFTELDLAEKKYENLSINIRTDKGNFFVTNEEVKEAVKNMGYATGDAVLRNINIKSLEDFFDKYPYIAKSQVFSTIKGDLIVEIKQRNPVLRIFEQYEGSYYLDEEGYLMPVSEEFTANVPVATGYIKAPYNLHYGVDYSDPEQVDFDRKSDQMLHDLFVLTTTLRENELWEAQVNQVYVAKNGDFELVPRVGNHTILVGSVNNLNDKLRKLKIFYFDGLSKTGWNEYKEINLKFDNQVVCTKR